MRALLLAPLLPAWALADAPPTSTHCDVTVMDDPLNFKTIFESRGQSLPQRLPDGTHTMCNYYDSQEYVGPGKVRSRSTLSLFFFFSFFLFSFSLSLFSSVVFLSSFAS